MIRKKDLLSLPVETVSGVALGRVVDIEIDTELHNVQMYIVRRHILPNPLAVDTNILRIHPRQVRSLTAEKMVVDDAVISEEERQVAPATPSPST